MSTIVFGASGFIGRWLIQALAKQDNVIAVVRSDDSRIQTEEWLKRHATLMNNVTFCLADLSQEPLNLSLPLNGIQDIYNVAGAYKFGMSQVEAFEANVESSRRIVEFGATIPELRRLVHLSGYRVGREDLHMPWNAEERRQEYERLGAYEASKIESDLIVRYTARLRNVPYSIVNPSTVIGHSHTGEAEQFIGLAAVIRDLLDGQLPMLSGNNDTNVPVVTVDYLIKFMMLLPQVPEADGQSYWILDEHTPALPKLIQQVGEFANVRVPRWKISPCLLAKLPRTITKAEPETLSFLSADSYPTASAQALAHQYGLEFPNLELSIQRWVNHLAAYDFGRSNLNSLPSRFIKIAGIRTHEVGNPNASIVILHGLPVDAWAWRKVLENFKGEARILSLPGLGASDGNFCDWTRWLDALVKESGPIHLIAHSAAAIAAVHLCSRHSESIIQLTLVSPAFLQPAPSQFAKSQLLVSILLRKSTPAFLCRLITGSDANAELLYSTRNQLRRPDRAKNVAVVLSVLSRPSIRASARHALTKLSVPVDIIIGTKDPLDQGIELTTASSSVKVTWIEGAGHHPYLTHPMKMSIALTEFS